MRNQKGFKNLKVGGIENNTRPGPGRPPDEFREMCRRLCSSPAFEKFALDTFDNKEVCPKLTPQGTLRWIPASPMEKKALWEILAAYGYGKPIQPVDLEEGARIGLSKLVEMARASRGVE